MVDQDGKESREVDVVDVLQLANINNLKANVNNLKQTAYLCCG